MPLSIQPVPSKSILRGHSKTRMHCLSSCRDLFQITGLLRCTHQSSGLGGLSGLIGDALHPREYNVTLSPPVP